MTKALTIIISKKLVKIAKPIYGALVVYKHTQKKYGTGHIAFIYSKLTNGDYAVLGGNQGESITINTHKGVYLDSFKCKLVGHYIPKSYLSIAKELMSSDEDFGSPIRLSNAKNVLAILLN